MFNGNERFLNLVHVVSALCSELSYNSPPLKDLFCRSAQTLRWYWLTRACTAYVCMVWCMLSGCLLFCASLHSADLVFVATDKPHSRFTREGADLHYCHTVPLYEVSPESLQRKELLIDERTVCYYSAEACSKAMVCVSDVASGVRTKLLFCWEEKKAAESESSESTEKTKHRANDEYLLRSRFIRSKEIF